ncbi:MAG: polysaccharide biosynthesis C-terminal domain-containing protein [Acidobacteriota bacterium]|nr:polysaccharide biosynthesis C-terminal domain-containing protein [Acidobacteriota bacterium]
MTESPRPAGLSNATSPDELGILPARKLSIRIASAVSATGVGSVITLTVSSLAGIAVARNGGPHGYAVYVSANMIVFVGAALCSFGLPLALAKHVAAEEEIGGHESLRRSITTTLVLTLSITLLVSTVISTFLSSFEQYLGVPIGRGFAIALPLVMLCAVTSDCVQSIYIGLLRPRPVIAIAAAGPLAVLVYSMARRSGISLPIWGAIAALYGVSGVMGVCFLVRGGWLGAPFSLARIKPLLQDTIPAAAFTFFMVFSSWSDRWIVGARLGAVAMGSYAAAVVILQAALRIPTQVAILLVPASARVALSGPENSKNLNTTAISLFGLFAAFVTVAIMLEPATLVRSIFGPGFVQSGPVLLIMAPSLLVSAISIPFISVLTGSSKNRVVTWLLGLTIIPRIVLLIVFTRHWGLPGTAFGTLFADSLLALCCIILARKLQVTLPLTALIRPYMIGILAYLVGSGALLLGVPAFVALPLGLLVFVFPVWRLVQGALAQRPRSQSAKPSAYRDSSTTLP